MKTIGINDFLLAAFCVSLFFLLAGTIITREGYQGSSKTFKPINLVGSLRHKQNFGWGEVVGKILIVPLAFGSVLALLLFVNNYVGPWALRIYLSLLLAMIAFKLVDRIVMIVVGDTRPGVMGMLLGCAVALGATASWVLYSNAVTLNIAGGITVLWLLVSVSFANYATASIVSGGVMIYDAYAVFHTHQMMAFVKATKGIPTMVSQPAFSIGLGDIALPGLIVMLAFHVGKRLGGMGIVYGAVLGYLAGLSATLIVLRVTGMPQPATIYLLPGTLIGYAIGAYATGKREALVRDLVETSSH